MFASISFVFILLHRFVVKRTLHSKSAFVGTVKQELGCALCLGNLRVYDQSLIALPHGVGRGLMPGLNWAVDEAGDV